MSQYKPTAEEKILESAKSHFVLKGYSGARMQEIANSAGVNKALLHYYFESKELLFGRVMEDTLEAISGLCKVLTNKEAGNLHQRFRLLVHKFLQLMLREPFLPGFVLHEAQQNPEIMYPLLQKHQAQLGELQLEIDMEAEAGLMQRVDARHLLVNIFSVALFPFLSMQVAGPIVFHNNQEELGKMLDQRQAAVDELVLNKIFVPA
jgi:AcrR family transcriptional regulator